ncbi:hypothetical protein VMF7928_02337 [Vibrio marisflavi CECT 7928]|uniref:Ferric siderophore reductase C-terminal domain-containing protein n=1 Tax=Vibrio marisflavi CECT 7928 TaxID=634439 RepID=A0ABN8E362_9VIBR|nr:hypothetical protein VMF7928_02337 [Vibrio marisflavi CECT 7928]
MKATANLDNLFDKALQVSPYLKGEPYSSSIASDKLLFMGRDCSAQINHLYESLAETYPEAGKSYYLTRTWDLLCWQPLYLSFVAIYQLQAVPKIQQIVQCFQPNSIYGFYFPKSEMESDQIPDMIKKVSIELKGLFDNYREQMSQFIRIRPGFTNHLFADALLKLIVRFQQTSKDLPSPDWLQHARLWLHHCGLPTLLADKLICPPCGTQLSYVRTSCCQVYRCSDGSLCDDCPRVNTNRS